jgi:5'-phosphate synthase pdxT subunit
MVAPLRAWVQSGRPVWGTCAGMILLADHATGQKEGGQTLLGGLHVTVNRNYFGRQTESFETELAAPVLGEMPIHAVFIRAPAIVEVGSDVQVLARTAGHGEEVIVAVRQGPLLATAFHPELTPDLRWHRYFLEMITAEALAPH